MEPTQPYHISREDSDETRAGLSPAELAASTSFFAVTLIAG
jgi:hypothetical protein